MKKQRILWVDFAKGIAITSVVIQHSVTFFSWIYTFSISPFLLLQLSIFFNWFYFIIGITSAWSIQRLMTISSATIGRSTIVFWKKKLPIIFLYVISAAFCYFILPSSWQNEKTIQDYISRLLRFSVIPPHYFFWTLIQFLFISPFVVYLVYRINHFSIYIASLVLVILLTISVSTVYYYPILTSPRPLILGGWAFVLFYLGVGYAKFSSLFTHREVVYGIVSIICVECIVFYTKNYQLLSDLSPLVIILVVSSILLVKHYQPFLIRYVPFLKLFEFFGRHSLIIYLFHWSILERITTKIALSNHVTHWSEFIAFIIIGLFVPSVGSVIVQKVFFSKRAQPV